MGKRYLGSRIINATRICVRNMSSVRPPLRRLIRASDRMQNTQGHSKPVVVDPNLEDSVDSEAYEGSFIDDGDASKSETKEELDTLKERAIKRTTRPKRRESSQSAKDERPDPTLLPTNLENSGTVDEEEDASDSEHSGRRPKFMRYIDDEAAETDNNESS